MIEFEEEEEEQAGGAPAWMATFADLMSLLMCFFVLLLSFSELDVQKYKQVAGSMRDAFGVQNEVRVKDIPKGTSIVAKEFSPGRPNPTPLNVVQQQSTNTSASSLDVRTPLEGEKRNGAKMLVTHEVLLEAVKKEIAKETAQAAGEIEEKLKEQIEKGNIEIEFDANTVTVRIRERGSFPSGSADIEDEFLPIIPIIRDALKDVEGEIAVEGHTDNVPIYNDRFKSNWELSSHRALALTHELLKDPELDPARFMVAGFADTRPRASNDNWEDRAENRRVEVVVRRVELLPEGPEPPERVL